MAARMLAIERFGGGPDELREAWQALQPTEHPGAPFRSFAWIAAWWREAPPAIEPFVLVLRRDGQVAAILPAYLEPAFFGGRRLRLMGDDVVGSDYLGVVAPPGQEATAAALFAEELCAELRRGGLAELVFDGLAEDDPLAVALAASDEAVVRPRYQCPAIRLAGSFDAYLEGRPGGVGGQWRRRRRWLAKRPGFRIHELAAPAEVAGGLETLFALHRARWRLEGGSDAITGSRVERFHRRSGVALARRGWARVFVLAADGAPRAALYGFRHGGRFAFYQAGHDPDWRCRSVGTVLLGEVIGRCFADGAREFDFLRGDESYKQGWATGARRTVEVRVVGRGARAWLGWVGASALRAVREGVKSSIPTPALDRLRRTRKQLAASWEDR
jgi:CelD/BcsL family acetyltransferase involved in cellulose biosynthesis